jgi:hypothetical protein
LTQVALGEGLKMEIFDMIRSVWHLTPGPMKVFSTAAGGVVFGAWLTSRAQNKRNIVSELHALRAAHALCYSITNKALSLKKQHLVSMKSAYDAATEAHDAVMTKQGPRIFEIQLDLRTLSKTSFPTAALERILHDKCFVGGETIATAVAVTDAAYDLNLSLDYRNSLVAEFRNSLPADLESKTAIYLGLLHSDTVDDRLRNNLEAICLQADCCIFFGRRLGGQLLSHENRVRRRAWSFRLPGRALEPIDWQVAEDTGLMPPDADFADWTKGFVRQPTLMETLKVFRARF